MPSAKLFAYGGLRNSGDGMASPAGYSTCTPIRGNMDREAICLDLICLQAKIHLTICSAVHDELDVRLVLLRPVPGSVADGDWPDIFMLHLSFTYFLYIFHSFIPSLFFYFPFIYSIFIYFVIILFFICYFHLFWDWCCCTVQYCCPHSFKRHNRCYWCSEQCRTVGR